VLLIGRLLDYFSNKSEQRENRREKLSSLFDLRGIITCIMQTKVIMQHYEVGHRKENVVRRSACLEGKMVIGTTCRDLKDLGAKW
jgi:hypothetical protein